jgi:7-cyano-7-deazaguanine synthase
MPDETTRERFLTTSESGGRRIVLLCSGGIDSAIVGAILKSQGRKFEALTVDYGQRARKELRAACNVARALGVPHLRVRAQLAGRDPLLRTGRDEPTLTTATGGDLRARNLMLLSLAAVTLGRAGGIIAIGSAPSDGYTDARRSYFNEVEPLINVGPQDSEIRILTPLLDFATRVEAVREGLRLHAPLKATWSCWRSGMWQCGSCLSCIDRCSALRAAGALELAAKLSRDRRRRIWSSRQEWRS